MKTNNIQVVKKMLLEEIASGNIIANITAQQQRINEVFGDDDDSSDVLKYALNVLLTIDVDREDRRCSDLIRAKIVNMIAADKIRPHKKFFQTQEQLELLSNYENLKNFAVKQLYVKANADLVDYLLLNTKLTIACKVNPSAEKPLIQFGHEFPLEMDGDSYDKIHYEYFIALINLLKKALLLEEQAK